MTRVLCAAAWAALIVTTSVSGGQKDSGSSLNFHQFSLMFFFGRMCSGCSNKRAKDYCDGKTGHSTVFMIEENPDVEMVDMVGCVGTFSRSPVWQEKMKQKLILSGIVGLFLMRMAVAVDCGLTVVRKELPSAGNAYTLWAKALPQLRFPEDDGLFEAFIMAYNLKTNMPTGEVRRKLERWLELRKDAFVLLRQGIALGQLQFPAFGVDDFARFDLGGLRDAARAKVILAREQVERCEYAEAAREFWEVFEMGRLITAGDGPMIHYLVGIAVQFAGLNGMRWLAANPDIPSAVLSQMLHDMPVVAESDAVLAQVYRVEFAQFAVPQVKKIEQDALSPTNKFPICITRVLDVPTRFL